MQMSNFCYPEGVHRKILFYSGLGLGEDLIWVLSPSCSPGLLVLKRCRGSPPCGTDLFSREASMQPPKWVSPPASSMCSRNIWHTMNSGLLQRHRITTSSWPCVLSLCFPQSPKGVLELCFYLRNFVLELSYERWKARMIKNKAVTCHLSRYVIILGLAIVHTVLQVTGQESPLPSSVKKL